MGRFSDLISQQLAHVLYEYSMRKMAKKDPVKAGALRILHAAMDRVERPSMAVRILSDSIDYIMRPPTPQEIQLAEALELLSLA